MIFTLVLVTSDLFSDKKNSSSKPSLLDMHQNLPLFEREALELSARIPSNLYSAMRNKPQTLSITNKLEHVELSRS